MSQIWRPSAPKSKQHANHGTGGGRRCVPLSDAQQEQSHPTLKNGCLERSGDNSMAPHCRCKHVGGMAKRPAQAFPRTYTSFGSFGHKSGIDSISTCNFGEGHNNTAPFAKRIALTKLQAAQVYHSWHPLTPSFHT